MQALHECGATVYLLTSKKHEDKDWPRESLENIFYMESDDHNHWNMQDAIKGLAWLMRDHDIDRIVSLDDFDVEKGALLREEFRIDGMGQSTARYFRDKLAMRIKAKEAGILVPEFTSLFHDADINYFADTVPTPWMLKPRGEASATGIKKIYTKDDLWENIHDLKEDRHTFLLERFIPGQVYHMDSVLQDSKVAFVRCSQYLAPPFEVAHGGGIFRSATLDLDSEDHIQLATLNEQIMHAFHMRYSATHSEALKANDTGKFYFIETSARVGGAHIAEMVEAATGLNLWAEWAKVEYANATKTVYDDPIMKKDLAGILISLIKDPKPDYNMFSDKEIVWRMEDQDHHIGMIVSSHERQIVLDLLDKFSHVVKERFHAAAPAPDKPIH